MNAHGNDQANVDVYVYASRLEEEVPLRDGYAFLPDEKNDHDHTTSAEGQN